jgi:superfamily II DNA or RNA helicase
MLLHHQEFAKNFISPDSNNRSALLLFSTGAGKSFTAISICESFLSSNLYGYYEFPIIVGKNDITNTNFKKQVDAYNRRYNKKLKMKYTTIFKVDSLKLDPEYKYIFIYDEVHHVRKINKLYNKIKIHKGVVLFLTATKYIDKVEEFYDIMELLPQKNILKYTNNEYNVKVIYRGEDLGYKYPVVPLDMSTEQKRDYLSVPDTSIRCEKVYETLVSKTLRSKLSTMNLSEVNMNMLQTYAIKIYTMLKNIQYPAYIYCEYIKENGIQSVVKILEAVMPGIKIAVCTGEISHCESVVEEFNDPANIDGSVYNVLIGSKIISESISLKNVKQVHILTLHWNYSLLDQVIGRAIRIDSHIPGCTIEIFIYMIKDSIDEIKLNISKRKYKEVQVDEYNYIDINGQIKDYSIYKNVGTIECNLNSMPMPFSQRRIKDNTLIDESKLIDMELRDRIAYIEQIDNPGVYESIVVNISGRLNRGLFYAPSHCPVAHVLYYSVESNNNYNVSSGSYKCVGRTRYREDNIWDWYQEDEARIREHFKSRLRNLNPGHYVLISHTDRKKRYVCISHDKKDLRKRTRGKDINTMLWSEIKPLAKYLNIEINNKRIIVMGQCVETLISQGKVIYHH